MSKMVKVRILPDARWSVMLTLIMFDLELNRILFCFVKFLARPSRETRGEATSPPSTQPRGKEGKAQGMDLELSPDVDRTPLPICLFYLRLLHSLPSRLCQPDGLVQWNKLFELIVQALSKLSNTRLRRPPEWRQMAKNCDECARALRSRFTFHKISLPQSFRYSELGPTLHSIMQPQEFDPTAPQSRSEPLGRAEEQSTNVAYNVTNAHTPSSPPALNTPGIEVGPSASIAVHAGAVLRRRQQMAASE